MSKTITSDKTEPRSVRFDSEENIAADQPPRRSRRNQGLSTEIPLDSMNLPVQGANELLARDNQETLRGRQKQPRKWPFWSRSGDKVKDSKDAGSNENVDNRGSLSDPEDKKKGAIKKLTFGRGRATSYTSPSSQSSRSPSQERPRLTYKSLGPFSTEGAPGWRRATPFEIKSERGPTKPLRLPPPDWGKASNELSMSGQLGSGQAVGGELPPPYLESGIKGPLGPPLKPSGNPLGGLDDSFRSVPTINPFYSTSTNQNPYDALNRMIKQMPEHPYKVNLDKSRDTDVTLTPSLFGEDSSQVEDLKMEKRVLEQPPRSAAEFAGHLKNKDRSASTPPASSEDDPNDTAKTGETVIK